MAHTYMYQAASLRPNGAHISLDKMSTDTRHCVQAWRVIFALVSLPLALSAIVFFINHRYDGVMLWDVKTIPGEPAEISCDIFARF